MRSAIYFKKIAEKSGIGIFLKTMRAREQCTLLLSDRFGNIIAPDETGPQQEHLRHMLESLHINDITSLFANSRHASLPVSSSARLDLFAVTFPQSQLGALVVETTSETPESENDIVFYEGVAHMMSSVLARLGTNEVPQVAPNQPDSFSIDSSFIARLNEVNSLPLALQHILSHLTTSTDIDAVGFIRVDNHLKQTFPLYHKGFKSNIFSEERTRHLFDWKMCSVPEPLFERIEDGENLDDETLKMLALYPLTFSDEVVARLILGSHISPSLSLRTRGLVESITQMLSFTMARIKAEQAMEESDERYRTIFNTNTDAMMLLNSSHFLECNDSALKLFKVETREQFIQMHPSDVSPVFQPDGTTSWQKSITEINAALDEGTNRFYWKHMRRNGEEFDAEVTLTAFTLNGERVLQATVRDITEVLQAKSDLEEARDKLEKTNAGLLETIDHTNRLALQAHQALADRGRFLAKIAHEIRTPMSGIIGMGDLLQETDLNRIQSEYVATIVSSATTLTDMLNDLLDYSKMEAGKLELASVPFSLRKQTDEIANIMGITAHDKGLEYLTFLDPRIPDTVIGDPVRLRQVLLNLTGNAIKFTYTGQVALRITLKDETKEGLTLEFSIKDSGIGIPRETIDSIFEAYTQGSEEITKDFGGTGLGLSITKHLLSRMGGTISVDSRVNEGTDFQFVLHFKRNMESSESLDFSFLHEKTIVLTDPKESSRNNLAEMLSSRGAVVQKAPNTMVAMEKVAQLISAKKRCDCIIVSEVKGDRTTREFFKYLREDRNTRTIPVVLVTEPGIALSDQQLEELGVTTHLIKPFKTALLHQSLQSALSPRSSRTTQPLKAINLPKTHERDYSRIRVLVTEDNRINQKVAVRILSRLGIQTKVARTGEEALHLLNEDTYDMILMDVEMPVMDGIAATIAIRAGECGDTNAKIPIIGMTGYTIDNVLDKCIQSGMNGYITKPLRPLDLYKIIETYIPE